ncbi:GNAT family N-acetyltransferase [Kaistella carnis]|uniref:GNAT family N-acetyltransferase n=2 Tax=Kaistella carnis TaxID=1241979 RepID=UPI0028A90E79|nr:GNAT family N-acetyltransferase [Kaistella carnis]
MEAINIRRALPSDHSVLTEITRNGKAFWDYSIQQLKTWETELTITSKYISENKAYKLVLDNEIIGYYAYIQLGEGHLELDHLFLVQKFIGKGFGQLLLTDFLRKAKELNTIDIILEADPNAELFYKKFGFVTYDQRESSIKERFLPLMKLDFK